MFDVRPPVISDVIKTVESTSPWRRSASRGRTALALIGRERALDKALVEVRDPSAILIDRRPRSAS
jgi:hypothetical protein